MVRLICSGGAWGFTRASPLGLKQVVHDVCDNSIFVVLLEGLTIGNVNANPILDLGTLKTHL